MTPRKMYAIPLHLSGTLASDLKFYNDEIQFLRSLIDKYFMWLTDDKNISSTRAVAVNLSNLEKSRLALEQKLTEHLHHLTNLVENPFPHNARDYKEEHIDLEKMLVFFMKDFRAIKKEIFLLTEQVIESEKVKHLLTS